jgi:hypothetical protein
MTKESVNSGIYMGNNLGEGNYSTKNVIEDFMRTEYQEGFRNEFNTMEALINKLPKDTITGKVKYKSFKLGISDNVRALPAGTFDRYELGMNDFWGQGSETVEAQFDTTKLMATFSITDEAILKGTGDGSLIDVLKDQLSNMELGMKHTYNRYIYGSHTGKIGEIKEKVSASDTYHITNIDLSTSTASAAIDRLRDNRGEYHNQFDYGKAPRAVAFKMVNSHSLMEGMGAMIQVEAKTANGWSTTANAQKRLIGYIWQKDNTSIHSETILFIVQRIVTGTATAGGKVVDGQLVADIAWGTPAVPADPINITLGANDVATVYSRQLDDTGAVAREYTGLEDIVVTQNNKIFGVDRSIYRSLNCTAVDMHGDEPNGHYVNEEILRDLSDHLALTSPDGTSITLCCANHRIISQVEKALYQFKNYNLTNVGQGMQLGGSYELKFDNYVLYKDKYARDNNLYMLDQTKIGELVRRDFTWITSGEVNGVLQRRPGTEMYEGIMNKYADMYIDAWRCHAVLKHCKVTEPGTFFSYQSNGLPKGIADGATSVQITGVAEGVKFPQD